MIFYSLIRWAIKWLPRHLETPNLQGSFLWLTSTVPPRVVKKGHFPEGTTLWVCNLDVWNPTFTRLAGLVEKSRGSFFVILVILSAGGHFKGFTSKNELMNWFIRKKIMNLLFMIRQPWWITNQNELSFFWFMPISIFLLDLKSFLSSTSFHLLLFIWGFLAYPIPLPV